MTKGTDADHVCHPPQSVDIEKERELERQARIEASLREREREVQKARSEQTKEIDREREQHKREEAIQHFKALMSDMVRCWAVLFFPHKTSVLHHQSLFTFSQDLIQIGIVVSPFWAPVETYEIL